MKFVTCMLAGLFMAVCLPDAVSATHKEVISDYNKASEAKFRSDPGLYCLAVPTTNDVEQGIPLNVSISLFARPAELPSGVKNLNTFWMQEFFRLYLTNQETGQSYSLDLEEFDNPGFLEDDLSKVQLLDGRRMGPWEMEFRLVRLRKELVPGRYICAVEFAYPTGPHKHWTINPNREKWRQWTGIGRRRWEQFGFWSGRIVSAPFTLDVRKEEPKLMQFVVPKNPRMERADDGTYQLVFKKEDVETVARYVHNGFVIGQRTEYPGPGNGSSSLGGPWEYGREDEIYKIPPGKQHVRFRATVFETTVAPHRFWGPKAGTYNVLWEVNFETNLTDNIAIPK